MCAVAFLYWFSVKETADFNSSISLLWPVTLAIVSWRFTSSLVSLESIDSSDSRILSSLELMTEMSFWHVHAWRPSCLASFSGDREGSVFDGRFLLYLVDLDESVDSAMIRGIRNSN